MARASRMRSSNNFCMKTSIKHNPTIQWRRYFQLHNRRWPTSCLAINPWPTSSLMQPRGYSQLHWRADQPVAQCEEWGPSVDDVIPSLCLLFWVVTPAWVVTVICWSALVGTTEMFGWRESTTTGGQEIWAFSARRQRVETARHRGRLGQGVERGDDKESQWGWDQEGDVMKGMVEWLVWLINWLCTCMYKSARATPVGASATEFQP